MSNDQKKDGPPPEDDVLYLDIDDDGEDESLEDILRQAQESADRLAERQKVRADDPAAGAEEGFDAARIEEVASEARLAAAEVLEEPPAVAPSRPRPARAADRTELALEVEELGAQNELLRKEVNEYKEGLLRKQADFENFRKRMQRDKDDFKKHAVSSVLKEILPVLDNLDRALMVDHGADIHSMRQGVELVMKQLKDAMGRFGLSDVVSVGQEFDPNFHEAVSSEESAEHPPNTVIEELQKGYLHHDRLLRAAFVKVATAPAGTAAPSAEASPPTPPAPEGTEGGE